MLPAPRVRFPVKTQRLFLFHLKARLLVRELRAVFKRPLYGGISCTLFVAVAVGLWAGCRWLLDLANQIAGIGPLLVDRLLYLAFLTLFVGLTLSAATVGYFLLYRSREVKQWINWPMAPARIVLWRGAEAWVLSSWVFLLIGLILMAAYAQVEGLPSGFFIRCLLFFLPFTALTTALGLWGALLWARFVTNRARAALLLGVILTAAVRFLHHRSSGGAGGFFPLDISQWLPYFGIYSSPWLPSSWMTQGILSFKIPGERGAVLNLALLTSHALIAWDLLGMVSRRWYLPSWDRQSSFDVRPVFLLGPAFWNRIGRFFIWLPPRVCAVALKDLKGFWRDPAQWPQGVISFGILGIYFANLRSFAYDLGTPEWKVLIAFLNFVGLSLTLASLSVRFLFPQMSLELRSTWMLGLTPVSLSKVFRIKCLVHAMGAFLLTGGLLSLANVMLRLERGLSSYLLLLMAFVTFPLVTIPLGMGACFPRVQEDNPLRIVSGVGGMLAFSSCLFEVLVVLGLVSWPVLQVAKGQFPLEHLWPVLWAVGAGAAVLCVVTGWLALRAGAATLGQVEPLLNT